MPEIRKRTDIYREAIDIVKHDMDKHIDALRKLTDDRTIVSNDYKSAKLKKLQDIDEEIKAIDALTDELRSWVKKHHNEICTERDRWE